MTAGDPKEVMPAFRPRQAGRGQGAARAPIPRSAAPTICAAPSPPGSAGATASPATSIRRARCCPLNGSREGLFFAALPAVGRKRFDGRPLMLLPNPFYQAYLGGARSAPTASPYYLNATAETGICPISMRWSASRNPATRGGLLPLLARQSARRGRRCRLLRKALALARQYDFMLFLDECYSEIYAEPRLRPAACKWRRDARALQEPDRLQFAVQALEPARHALGLRRRRWRFPRDAGRDPQPDGSADAGHRAARLGRRLVGGAARRASSAEAYRAKFDICDELLAGRFGYRRPGRRLLPLARHEPSGRR